MSEILEDLKRTNAEMSEVFNECKELCAKAVNISGRTTLELFNRNIDETIDIVDGTKKFLSDFGYSEDHPFVVQVKKLTKILSNCKDFVFKQNNGIKETGLNKNIADRLDSVSKGYEILYNNVAIIENDFKTIDVSSKLLLLEDKYQNGLDDGKQLSQEKLGKHIDKLLMGIDQLESNEKTMALKQTLIEYKSQLSVEQQDKIVNFDEKTIQGLDQDYIKIIQQDIDTRKYFISSLHESVERQKERSINIDIDLDNVNFYVNIIREGLSSTKLSIDETIVKKLESEIDTFRQQQMSATGIDMEKVVSAFNDNGSAFADNLNKEVGKCKEFNLIKSQVNKTKELSANMPIIVTENLVKYYKITANQFNNVELNNDIQDLKEGITKE